jgi:outer membrane immunogenic protein
MDTPNCRICRCKAALRAASDKRDLHMMKTVLAGATLALLFMTNNVVADGIPKRSTMVVATPEPVPTPVWTGVYLGLGLGGHFATHNESSNLDGLRLWDLDNGDARLFGTVTVGYDRQFSSRWVAGVFVDYDFGNGDNQSRFAQIDTIRDVRLSHDNGHAWSIGGRLGFLSSPTTLLYASTGWTRFSVDGDLSFLDVDGIQHTRSFGGDRDGWFLGAGIETQLGWLSSNWSLRAEYRFTWLDDDHRGITFEDGACGLCSRRLEFDHDIDIHSVRVLLSYKFGQPVAAPW